MGKKITVEILQEALLKLIENTDRYEQEFKQSLEQSNERFDRET